MPDALDMPPLGVASWNIAAPSLMERVEWIVDNGFTAVSLHFRVAETDESERRDVADAVRAAGLEATFHGGIGYGPDGAADWDRLERVTDEALRWHERTGAVHCLCFDPMHLTDATGRTHTDWNACRRVLLATHAKLAGAGIRTGLENNFGAAGRYRGLAEMERLRRECGLTDLGMLLDTGHANIHVRSDGVQGETDLEAFIAAMPFEIVEVHVSDNTGDVDRHLPIGEGNLDLRAVMRSLRKRAFAGVLTVEVCPGLEPCRLDSADEMDQILRTRDAVVDAWTIVGGV